VDDWPGLKCLARRPAKTVPIAFYRAASSANFGTCRERPVEVAFRESRAPRAPRPIPLGVLVFCGGRPN